jgi:hypothetical protein
MAEERSREELAELALRQLRSTAVPVEEAKRVDERRPRLVAAIEREIRSVPARQVQTERRRVALRVALGIAAAAGLAWGGTALWTQQNPPAREVASLAEGAQLRGWSGDVRVGPPGREHALRGPEDAALGVRSFLSTRGSGWVELELPGAVQVEVKAETELQLLKAEAAVQHLELARGRIDVRVPKAEPGRAHRVVVSTPDAEVLVRGTIFSVEVRPSEQDPQRVVTEVFVQRGEVAVRHGGQEHAVRAGQTWSSSPGAGPGSAPRHNEAAAAPSAPPSGGNEQAESAKSATPDLAARRVPKPAGQEPPSASSLAEENRLFLRALAARDRGAYQDTVRLCDEFLRRFPHSTHAESVRLERTRAAEQMGGR